MSTDDAAVQRAEMASRLRGAREYLGLSQEEVASALKVSRPAVTNIEAGTRKVEAIELEQLANLYGRPVTFFLTGEESVGRSDTAVAFAARALQGLSPRDLDEVARFADYLRATGRSKVTGRNKR
jgi:transcriptional regulator with XRE-family HTH domain